MKVILGRWCPTVLFVGLVTLLVPLSGMSASRPVSSSSPDTTRTPDRFDLQGHRGARGLAPENTIPAFRKALEIGVTTLEMDVVIAADRTVVVSHEPWMARTKCLAPDETRIPMGTEKKHNIYDMSYEEVAAYDCGSLKLSEFPEQVPTPAAKPRLQEVIQMAESRRPADGSDADPVFYNIEIKSRPAWDDTYHPDPETFAQRVLSVVSDEGVASRTTIQSFDPRSLEAVHRQNSTVRTALLVGRSGDRGLVDNVKPLSFVPDIYSPDARLVDAELVKAVHDRGMQLIPWTVNEPAAMNRLLELGVDGFITDYPNRGGAVLQSKD